MSYGKEKPNTLQMMEKFNTALSDIESFNTELDELTEKVNKKLTIINAINNFTTEQQAELDAAIDNYANTDSVERIIFARDKDKIQNSSDYYDFYGQTIHANYIQMPNNIFNIITETGPIFKDNVKVEIYESQDLDDVDWKVPNDAYKYQYCDVLKEESDKSKDDVFKIFTSNDVTMRITANVNSLIGDYTFDTIEFCPYLPGGMNVKEIRLYTMSQYLQQDLLFPELTLSQSSGNYIDNLGNVRIALDDSYQLYQIEIDFELTNENKFFGLRHLYFYRTYADTSSDYVIVKVECKKKVQAVSNNVVLFDALGKKQSTTVTAYGIELYKEYSGGELYTDITPDQTFKSTDVFYAKIPLTQPLVGIEFNVDYT